MWQRSGLRAGPDSRADEGRARGAEGEGAANGRGADGVAGRRRRDASREREAERAAVARVRALRSEGKSLRPIAATFDAERHRPRGKRWPVETLSRSVSAADAPRW